MKVFVGVILRDQKDTMKDPLKKNQADIASLKASIGTAQQIFSTENHRAALMLSPSVSSGAIPTLSSHNVPTHLNQSKYVANLMKLYIY